MSHNPWDGDGVGEDCFAVNHHDKNDSIPGLQDD